MSEIKPEKIEGIDISDRLDRSSYLPENLDGDIRKTIADITKELGYPEEITKAIRTPEEAMIYKEADLTVGEIDGKPCLIRSDIDWEQKDLYGRPNRERIKQGLSPINREGEVIDLHHIGQHADSPLAELTPQEHRGPVNHSILHSQQDSEINRSEFAKERNAHWTTRLQQAA